ncbi:MAG: hypothetical protein JWM33_1514 [Caulobacteraceae bacterium]|nr:hypothetical protein [Caulobacteraceae bacterium]
MTQAPIQHYIVSRSRQGWTVTAEADRLSEHTTADQARRHAEELALRDRQRGQSAEVIDLANDQGPGPPH